MAKTKACPSCNNEIPGDSRFCPQCGAPQALSCAACGHANAPGSRFCAQCGVTLGEAAPRDGHGGDGHGAGGTRTRRLDSGTPPTHGDVLRPRRLDRALDAPRSGGSARGHCRLSRLRRRGGHALWRLCRQIYGRRRAGLFRLSRGERNRRRECGARRARAGRRRRPIERRRRSPRGAHRPRHRLGGCRRARRCR